jgi:DNA replication initiation complex subunit (GINS family)
MAVDDEQLTFERLFDLLRTEKNLPSLQKLPDSFFSDVITYLGAKLEMAKRSATSEVGQYDHAIQQLRNARKIVQEIYDRREKKIIALALSKSRTNNAIVDTSNLLLEEMSLYSNLVTTLSQFRNGIVDSVIDLKKPFSENQELLAQVKTRKVVEAESFTEKYLEEQEKRIDRNQNTFKVIVDIPEFMAPNMEMMGPFKAGESISLSSDVARVLLSNKQIKSDE